MGRTFAAILLVALLAVGGGAIATTAYQAGLSTAVTQAVADGATVVAPPYAAYGWGWGAGPGNGGGFFGFLGTLLLIVIVIGLIRAVIWGGRGHRGHDRDGSGHGWGSSRGDRMRDRFHGTFEDWHREAHGPGTSSGGTAGTTGSTGSTGSASPG